MSIDDTGNSPHPRAPTTEGARRRRTRWIVAVVLLLVALPSALLAAAVLLLPSETIARAAAERGEAALGVPLGIGDVEIDLLPVPSVALVRVRLGEEGRAIAAADRLLLRPRLLPLLRGQVTVREIAIDRPDIRLVVDRNGALNLPFAKEDEQPSGGGSDIEFAVDELRVRDGRLVYADMRDGTEVRLHGLEQTLGIEGQVVRGELTRVGLVGSLSSDSVDAELPARLAAPLRGVRFAIRHEAELDREADRLELTSLRLELQQLALEGSGRVEAVSDSSRRAVALELRTDEFSFEDLARSMPEGFLAGLLAGRRAGSATADSVAPGASELAGTPVQYAGRAQIETRIDGPVTRDSLPRIDGQVRFLEVGARREESQLVAGLAGTLRFSNDVVEARDVAGQLFGAPFTLALRVEDLAAPVATFATRGTARVEELLGLAGSSDSIRGSGSLPFDLRGTVRPGEPAASAVEGTVGLGGVTVQLASLRQPVRLEGGRVRFAGEALHLEDVAAAFGESRLRANAVAEGWLPALLADSSALPVLRFDAAGGTVDLDALLGPSESQYAPLLFARLADRPVQGKSAAEAAREAGLTLPELPRLRAEGTLRADRLVRNGVTYEGLEASIESSPTALSAPRLSFGLMGGTVDLGLSLVRGENDATLVAVYHLEDVGAGAFFSRFSTFSGDLGGALALDGEVSLQLDEQMLPVRPTVQSRGSMALTSGSLAGWPLLRSVGERLGLASFDTLAFREWSGRYQVAGPLVQLERSVQVGDRVQTEVAGTFDFAGTLDLGIVARLSPELVSRAAEPIRAAARSVAGEEGSVPVGVRITGSTTAPTIALDLSAARDNALAQARQKAEAEAEAAARRATAEVVGRALGDSVEVSPEAVGEVLRSRVQDRLRGLFGGGARSRAAESGGTDSVPSPIPAGADSAAAGGG